MRRLSIVSCAAFIIIFSAFLATSSSAGPNEGSVLAVHTDSRVVDTGGDPFRALQIPSHCDELSPTGTSGGSNIQWFIVLAVFPDGSSPEYNTCVFGLGPYDPAGTYVAAFGPFVPPGSAILEIPSDGWPLPNTGTAVSYAPSCADDGAIQPLYYFGIYAYGDGTIGLGEHPVHGGVFVECGAAHATDEIEEYGVMGFGSAAGKNPCGEPILREEGTWSQVKWAYRK
ncbi:MAG: hypothetical protein KJ970_20395 [Candidatus Eisenbacteria bacterium]|uniref:Uncharacterized protein n=1 Tax=Eiseniibacteriota bacterium TaxID=2212470 RepID=A0A948RYQ1_UNCEI|nr:hypothetical protein [Candidatus Eisenbacteria bacterium]MBU1948588.1 hypothetical protein [Candidatus Eisenbacteria bacterium]MBU2693285.1 hypothetical protein [Candidatus Eisenbacteria bacterium]